MNWKQGQGAKGENPQQVGVAPQCMFGFGFHLCRRVISRPAAAHPLPRAFETAAIHHRFGMTIKYQFSVPRAAREDSERGQPRARELERGDQNRGTGANWLTHRL